jgi:multicomponent Na+:H+ antiporter subunit B
MTELYLRLLDRILTPLLFLFSLFFLLRGHDLPGGGFIAALVASAAFTLQILARGAEYVRRRFGRLLAPGIGLGLLIAVSAALFGMVSGKEFFSSTWWDINIGAFHYAIGTPMFFDIGVFITVLCVVVGFILGLSETTIESPRERMLRVKKVTTPLALADGTKEQP